MKSNEGNFVWVRPMWALWLIDPSGKYGAHKPFAEYGNTAAEAAANAIDRYMPSGGGIISIDERYEPSLMQQGFWRCLECNHCDGAHAPQCPS